jgi:hypothetical protein
LEKIAKAEVGTSEECKIGSETLIAYCGRAGLISQRETIEVMTELSRAISSIESSRAVLSSALSNQCIAPLDGLAKNDSKTAADAKSKYDKGRKNYDANIARLKKQMGKRPEPEIEKECEGAREEMLAVETEALLALEEFAGRSDLLLLQSSLAMFDAYEDFLVRSLRSIEKLKPTMDKHRGNLEELWKQHRSRKDSTASSSSFGSSGSAVGGGHRMFGVRLDDIIRNLPSGTEIPPLVLKAFDYVRKTCMDEEGVFRLSGGKDDVLALKESSERTGTIDFAAVMDPHVVTGWFKMWLRELAEPLLTYALYDEWVALLNCKDDEQKMLAEIRILLPQMPATYVSVLGELSHLMHDIAAHADRNRMNYTNLAIVIGPNILRAKDALASNMISEMQAAQAVVTVMFKYAPDLWPQRPSAAAAAAKESTLSVASGSSDVAISAAEPVTSVSAAAGDAPAAEGSAACAPPPLMPIPAAARTSAGSLPTLPPSGGLNGALQKQLIGAVAARRAGPGPGQPPLTRNAPTPSDVPLAGAPPAAAPGGGDAGPARNPLNRSGVQFRAPPGRLPTSPSLPAGMAEAIQQRQRSSTASASAPGGAPRRAPRGGLPPAPAQAAPAAPEVQTPAAALVSEPAPVPEPEAASEPVPSEPTPSELEAPVQSAPFELEAPVQSEASASPPRSAAPVTAPASSVPANLTSTVASPRRTEASVPNLSSSAASPTSLLAPASAPLSPSTERASSATSMSPVVDPILPLVTDAQDVDERIQLLQTAGPSLAVREVSHEMLRLVFSSLSETFGSGELVRLSNGLKVVAPEIKVLFSWISLYRSSDEELQKAVVQETRHVQEEVRTVVGDVRSLHATPLDVSVGATLRGSLARLVEHFTKMMVLWNAEVYPNSKFLSKIMQQDLIPTATRMLHCALGAVQDDLTVLIAGTKQVMVTLSDLAAVALVAFPNADYSTALFGELAKVDDLVASCADLCEAAFADPLNDALKFEVKEKARLMAMGFKTLKTVLDAPYDIYPSDDRAQGPLTTEALGSVRDLIEIFAEGVSPMEDMAVRALRALITELQGALDAAGKIYSNPGDLASAAVLLNHSISASRPGFDLYEVVAKYTSSLSADKIESSTAVNLLSRMLPTITRSLLHFLQWLRFGAVALVLRSPQSSSIGVITAIRGSVMSAEHTVRSLFCLSQELE